MALPDRDSVRDWVGKTVVDRHGADIGTVTHLLADEETGAPEWLYADMAGTTVVVPLFDATEAGDRVQVVVDRGLVDGAPRYGESRELTTDQEAALYRHYGIETSTETSESLLPAPDAEVPATTAVATPDGVSAPPPVSTPAPATEEVEQLPPPPPVAQPGDRDFGRAEASGGGRSTAGIAGAVAAVLALGGVVFSLVRRRQQPKARVSRGARRTGRKAAKASRGVRRTGRRAARRAQAVPATGRARVEHLVAAAAPAVANAAQSVREAALTSAAAAGPAVAKTAQTVREAALSGATAAGPAVADVAHRLGEVTRSGASAAGPLLATTGHALQTGANAGADLTRQVVEVGSELAAAALSRVAEAGAEIGSTGLRAAMKVGGAIESVPEEVAEAGHRIRKTGKRAARLTSLGVGAGAGYVVGARYGDYGQIQQAAARLTGRG
ncbi:PRC-barrel domain protein [Geodermatophilus normandii]|uniref:PRC-barrel domain protein n=1 Tax=Geodermatophilus normandii TaxID=1137989 RepID=A0A317QHZ5_9ACTN|nr:PRC-barrel domain-containing protein [Geodermatophilus normandii]PWW21220.1 PRC-barrel domain protein [Geodermatophilus normandii]